MSHHGRFPAWRILIALFAFAWSLPWSAGSVRPAHASGSADHSTPTIQVTPSEAAVGDPVTIAGSGFKHNQNLTVGLQSAMAAISLATVTADASGAFSLDTTVPQGLASGPFSVAAWNGGGDLLAQAPFTVVDSPATATSSPVPATATTPPSATATDTSTDAPSPTATSVPDSPTPTPSAASADTATATPSPPASGAAGPSATATATAEVIDTSTATATAQSQPPAAPVPSSTATAVPTQVVSSPNSAPASSGPSSILVAPGVVSAGQSAAVVGQGFAPFERVDLTLLAQDGAASGVSLLSVSADGAGTFQQQVNIPVDAPGGAYRVAATGSQGDAALAALTVRARVASIRLGAQLLAPREVLTISGHDFLPGEAVTIELSAPDGTSSVTLGTVGADASGNFRGAAFTVPFGTPPGDAQVVATGRVSNLQASAQVSVRAPTPSLQLSRANVAPGGTVGLHLSGFQPGEAITIDLVTLSGALALAGATSDAAGSLSLDAVQIPGAAPSGRLTVVATGNTSHTSAMASLTIAATSPRLFVGPRSLRPAMPFQVSGTGFIAGETLALQMVGGSMQTLTLADATTDGAGAFNLHLILPAITPAGSYVLAVSGLVSGRVAALRLAVNAPRAVRPRLGIVSASQGGTAALTGNPGGIVQVAGTGFTPGARVALDLATVTNSSLFRPAGAASAAPPSLGVVAANAAGSIGPLAVTLPGTLHAGSYALQAKVAGRLTASTRLTVHGLSPHLQVGTTVLTAGRRVSLQGAGFRAGEQILTALNGVALRTSPSTIIADAHGRFGASFTVPASLVGGVDTITASGVNSRVSASARVQARLTVASRWYFANGDTTAGSQSRISLLNPGAKPASIHMTFLYQSAPERHYSTTLRAHAHASLDLGLVAGANRRIGIIVEADQTIGATLQITYKGHIVTTTLGATAPETSWYLAEGYTGRTFQEYLEIANPNTAFTTADVRFLPFNGQPPKEERFVIRPRATILVDARRYMPLKSISTVVTANRGIVVERTMRFGLHSQGAHDTIGSSVAATVWLFAQGETSDQRQTFLSILNPSQATSAVVTASFFSQTGQPLATKTIFIDPLHRGNIKLNDVLRQGQVATVLTSTVPVVAERSEYVGPPNLDLARSGSVLTGCNGGGTTWLFPSASADPRDGAHLYLFNPSLDNARLLATFYGDNGGIAQRRLTLSANSYSSVSVIVPRFARGAQIGAMITTQGGQAIVAELGGYNDDFKVITAGAGIP